MVAPEYAPTNTPQVNLVMKNDKHPHYEQADPDEILQYPRHGHLQHDMRLR
ncbi:TPA: hypothetical protein ACU967_005925 [Burkholderia contaminans]|uniref:hypothetical protein n=1 Tax=Burkholderia cepacia complex TaxID=87882 RepID=UPI001CF28E7F|nr:MULTISPECIES: hypothetical protein [Burkholderia cepacia complex]MCA7880877.1 hypothetical protein [Burkholderia contaminans]MDN8025800.1 hypothetical protein [Burkholderia contaminans]